MPVPAPSSLHLNVSFCTHPLHVPSLPSPGHRGPTLPRRMCAAFPASVTCSVRQVHRLLALSPGARTLHLCLGKAPGKALTAQCSHMNHTLTVSSAFIKGWQHRWERHYIHRR